MSARKEKLMSLYGTNFSGRSKNELLELYSKLLKQGMHGLCMSPYVEGQQPGDQLTREQIERRLDIMKPYTKWVRTFSCTEGNELIPAIAKEKGMKTLVGAWLGTDAKINELEITNVIKVAKEGYADIVAVGNEVLYREDLAEEELLKFIKRVKDELPGISVGYVDAYYEFCNRESVADACDVILANCYPFWEGCALEDSFLYMKDMYRRALMAAKGKKVIITETGWPNAGGGFYGAQASEENAIKYFINAQQWSKEEGIEMFYFSSFDEAWKTSTEGSVGPYWGIWDKDEKIKYIEEGIVAE